MTTGRPNGHRTRTPSHSVIFAPIFFLDGTLSGFRCGIEGMGLKSAGSQGKFLTALQYPPNRCIVRTLYRLMGHCHVPHNNQMFRVSHFLISLLELAKAGTVINAKLNSCRGSGAVL